jgi:sulfite reductase (NADPH) flavoprotein alpha-component
MFKNLWFQAHWLIGITAGIVLAIVGFTGGILSFESEIQQWLNRDVRAVAPKEDRRGAADRAAKPVT